MNDTYEANVRIKELPRSVDNLINTLASIQGRMKWEVVRAALIEYVENHKHEITVAAAESVK